MQIKFFIAFVVITAVRVIILVANKKSATPKIKAPAPFGEKIGTLWKGFAGIILCAAVFFLNPVEDMYYYGASFVGMPEMDAARIETYQTLTENGV